MVAVHTRNGDIGARKCCKKRILSMIAVLVVAVILGIAAMATIKMQHVSANADPLVGVYSTEHQNASAGSPLQGIASDIEYVWAARMWIEAVPDTQGGRLGYVSRTDGRDEAGSLEPAGFTHDGEDYTVQALTYQRTSEGDHKLVFETDRPLPAQLLLHVGSDTFFGCEFVVLGSEGNTNVWTIARDLGWADGQVTYAVLFEPMAHQVQPVIECLAASAEPGAEE